MQNYLDQRLDLVPRDERAPTAGPGHTGTVWDRYLAGREARPSAAPRDEDGRDAGIEKPSQVPRDRGGRGH